MATKPICTIGGCSNTIFRKGWCSAHWHRWQRHGDPLSGGTLNGEPLRYLREVVLAYEGDECLIWLFGKDRSGYAQIGRHDSVSRLICAEVHGAPPTPEHEAAHECGKGHKGCVTKGHLSWKTHADNMVDQIAHGTSNHGRAYGRAKLTVAEVMAIRSLHKIIPNHEISERFGITEGHVVNIVVRKSWGAIDD